MLTLVTGANSGKYFNFLKQVLANAIYVSNKNNIQVRIIVYDLGMNNFEIKEIQSIQCITLEKFDFHKYPEHVSLEKYSGNNCTYAWKPIIIYDVCEKYGGLVHWMDTRTLYSDFNILIKILETEYIYSPISNGTIQRWTHPKCLEYMKKYNYNLLDRARSGGVVGINYNIPWVKEMIKEWRDLSLIKECICPDGSDRSNHRQDQSIFTILFYKYLNLYKFKDIPYYVNLKLHNELLLNT